MFLQRFAQFLLKGRLQAAGLALLFACLPYFNWISAAIVGFITLRKGVAEGFVVLLWSALPAVVLAVVTHNWILLVSRILLGVLLVWALASLFVRLPRWTKLILVAVGAGLLAVVLFHIFVPDAAAWWQNYITQSAAQFEASVGMNDNAEAAKAVAQKISLVATGMNAAIFVLGALVELLLARFLDRSLPGALHAEAEHKQIRMPLWAVVVLFLGIVLSFWSKLVLDSLPLLVLPFFIAGFSLIGSFLVKRFSPFAALFVFFVLLIALMMIPILAVVIACLAVFDSVFNIRQRFGGGKRSE